MGVARLLLLTAALLTTALCVFAGGESGTAGIAAPNVHALAPARPVAPADREAPATLSGPILVGRQAMALPQAPDPWDVVGRVVNDAGRPVPGAAITMADALRGPPPDLREPPTARSGGDGSFSLRPATPGRVVRLLAYAPGVGMGAVEDARPGRPVTLVLRAGLCFVGRVQTRAGDPIAGASVTFRCAASAGIVELGAVADGQGRYRLECVPLFLHRASASGSGARLEVTAPGWAPHAEAVWGRDGRISGIDGEVHAYDFELDAGCIVRGWVVEAQTRRPIGGARVVAQWGESRRRDPGEYDPVDPLLPRVLAETRTDARGHFRLAHVPLSKHSAMWASIRTSASDHHSSEDAHGGTQENEVVRMEIHLRRTRPDVPPDRASQQPAGPGRRLVGAVVLPDGTPAVGARIGCESAHSSTLDPFTHAGDDGRFELTLCERGSWRLVAELPGYARATPSFQDALAPGDLALRLLPERWVRGRVRFSDGTAAYRIEVSATPDPAPDAAPGADPGTLHARTDGDGRFAIRALPVGVVNVEAIAWGVRRRCRVLLAKIGARSATERDELDLTLDLAYPPEPSTEPAAAPARSTLVVTALDARGEAFRGAPSGTLYQRGVACAQGLGDGGTGRLRFPHLEAGSYTLVTDAPGFAAACTEVAVPEASGEVAVRVRLQRGSTVRLSIEGPGPIDPEALTLLLRGAADNPFAGWHWTPRLDAEGRYCVRELPGGTWRVQASVLGEPDWVLAGTPWISTTDSGERSLALRLVRSGHARVRVQIPGRLEVLDGSNDSFSVVWARGRVEILGEGARPLYAEAVGGPTTVGPGEPLARDPTARAEVRARLAPGRYRLRVTADKALCLDRPFEVREGEETLLEATLPTPP